MINRLIDLALKNRFIVIALYVGLATWGWWALGATPINAIPEPALRARRRFTESPLYDGQATIATCTLWRGAA